MNESNDHTKFLGELAEPVASSMMENFRSIGYSLPTAIADVVDNSITARAKTIWINFDWKGPESVITILDNGKGMDETALRAAMRPGSKSPTEERDPNDLGRFGLGMKTASLSQCKHFTVASKAKGKEICHRGWDLKMVEQTDEWRLSTYLSSDSLLNRLRELDKGTCVIWEQIDRLVNGTHKESEEDLTNFQKAAMEVKNHLAMVFHRFIETGKVKFIFNGREIKAWDPYLKGEGATQPLTEEKFLGGRVVVRPYVLPHHSKISEDTFDYAKGMYGWNAHQGFYIYRNERLLVAGDWLGMFKKEEHYKLCRIMVDIPNNLDTSWQIDIKKSVARPPAKLKKDLYRIAKYARSKAQEIYRFRGKVIKRKSVGTEFHMIWQEKVRHGKRFYKINQAHPLIKEFIDGAQNTSMAKRILKMIEETVPVPLITLRESEEPEKQAKPFEGIEHDSIRKVMKQMYDNLIRSGRKPEEAKSMIINIEPFNYYPEYIELLN